MNLEEMEPELRPYYERKKKELGDGGALAQGWRRTRRSGSGTVALGLGEGDGGAWAQGRRHTRRSGSGTGTAALGLGDGDSDARARARGRGRRQPGGATVSARAG
jgi:hypothetical protein